MSDLTNLLGELRQSKSRLSLRAADAIEELQMRLREAESALVELDDEFTRYVEEFGNE